MSQYIHKQPDWGYQDLSYFVYKLTYAREKDNGRQEEYWETCQRVVEGVFNIQLKHCKQMGLNWNGQKAQASAQKMFQKMWRFKFLPPGRGLWLMGTSVVDKLGSAGLCNCGFISTRDIHRDFSMPFCWAADMLMLGVGVGFDTRGKDKLVIHKPNPKLDPVLFTIPDTREGWVEGLKLVLDSYAKPDQAEVRLDYHLIRKAGTPIKTFGGIASGPEPFRQGIEDIRSLLDAHNGKTLGSVGIVDIMNYIGKFVVSGNVRRSSEIAHGDEDDLQFMEMKNPKLYVEELQDRRWASNNAIFVTHHSDFTIPVQHIEENGEPGFVFLWNARHYGRMKDGWNAEDSSKFDNIDGFNPSLRAGTLILTQNGIIPIEQLDGKDNFCVRNFRGEWQPARAFKSGKNKQLYRIKFNSGYEVYCTPEHKWPLLTKNSNYKRDNKPYINYGTFNKIKTNELYGGEYVYMPENNRPLHNNPSEDFSNEDAFWFGWWHSDGWATYREECDAWQIGCIVADGDGEVIKQKIQNYLSAHSQQKIFGHRRHNVTEYNLRCSSLVEKTKMFNEQLDKYSLSSVIWCQNNNFVASFIDGLFSADGCVTKSNNTWTLCLTSKSEKLIDDIRRLLIFYGIQTRKKHTTTTLNGYNKTYHRYDLCISGHNIIRFANAFCFTHTVKQEKLMCAVQEIKQNTHRNSNEYLRVVSVEKTNIIEDVYDISVNDDTHTFLMETGITGNCAEQGLMHGELCCLAETFPANHDSAEEYYETLKYAFMYAKTVTLVPTHNSLTNQVMLSNRRIGLSMSGIQQALKKFGFADFFDDFCDRGYEIVRHWDRIYSRWFGIPTSIKVTTVKPSGTVSLLAGATPGVHCTHSKYYLQTFRIAAFHPLVQKLVDAGYRLEFSANDKTIYKNVGGDIQKWRNDLQVQEVPTKVLTAFGQRGGSLVVYFPVKEKNFTKSKFEISLWEQLSLARELQDKWSDNSVSITVTFKPEEAQDLKSAIEYLAPYVKTLSFLPLRDHQYVQAPYQECDEAEYNATVKPLKKLHLASVCGKAKGEQYCTNDQCEI